MTPTFSDPFGFALASVLVMVILAGALGGLVHLAGMIYRALRRKKTLRSWRPEVAIVGISHETIGRFGDAPIPESILVQWNTPDGHTCRRVLPYAGVSTPSTTSTRPRTPDAVRLHVSRQGIVFANDVPGVMVGVPQTAQPGERDAA